jgi:histidinol dehydrogenase
VGIVKVLSHKDGAYRAWRKSMNRFAEPDAAVAEAVASILREVRHRGDAGIRDLTLRFDKYSLRSIPVTAKPPTPAKPVLAALKAAHANIASFSARRLPKSWETKNTEGAIVGEVFRPFERVGIYVPGGSAPLISTALMTVTLAKVAGCKEIVVVTPPPVDPILLFAIRLAGATEVFQVGGAQAIAALALGTETIRRVQKIAGPGNAYVTEAKRQLLGAVSIDLLPGPSEVMVIADASANPKFVAADLLAQAEHGPGSAAILLAVNSQIRDEVKHEIDRQARTLSRGEILRQALDTLGVLADVGSLDEAVKLANDFAPEHLSLQVKDGKSLLKKITCSGAVFLGPWSPVAAGDFLAGPSHTLPTGGAAKSFGGLTADMFLRRTSVIEYSQKALAKARGTIETLAGAEKLDAHAKSVAVRFAK